MKSVAKPVFAAESSIDIQIEIRAYPAAVAMAFARLASVEADACYAKPAEAG